MTRRNDTFGPQTTAIHAGEGPDATTGASAPAIHMSSTFVTDAPAGFSAHDLGPESPYLYARWANPTVDMLERKLAALEGCEACLCTASGMAAASAIFLTFLSAGDHAVVSDVSYAGVAELARDTLPRMGIEVSLVDMSDLDALAAAIRPNTRLVHTETPVNPIGRLTDLAAVARIAHEADALLSCDSTFASPLGQRAADLGVDLIMHSVTKYVGGHGDAVGGAIASRADLIKRMRLEASIHHGGIMSPFNAWLIARGAATLPLRMRAHEDGALKVASWLEGQPTVTRVIHPGLASHPGHALARSQQAGFGAMLSFELKGGTEAIGRFARHLQVFTLAESLGGIESLVAHPATMTHAGMGVEARRKAGIDDSLLRVSVGLEAEADLLADLDGALAATG